MGDLVEPRFFTAKSPDSSFKLHRLHLSISLSNQVFISSFNRFYLLFFFLVSFNLVGFYQLISLLVLFQHFNSSPSLWNENNKCPEAKNINFVSLRLIFTEAVKLPYCRYGI